MERQQTTQAGADHDAWPRHCRQRVAHLLQVIVEAVREVGLKLPLVVRLEGNNVAAGKKTLAESGLTIVSGDTMADAAYGYRVRVEQSRPAARTLEGCGYLGAPPRF